MIRRLFKKDKEKGASLIEASILLPMLILLAVGLSEIGFLVIDYLTVSNAAREGARTGAAAADYDDPISGTDADDLILNSVEEAACNLKFGEMTEVSIFKADGNGDPIIGSINIYEPAASGLECGIPANGLVCVNGCPWSPGSRDREPPGFDVLGVEVVFTHSDVTGFFPFPTVIWDETAIMQIEPDTRGSQ
ncbi:MAG: TadE family protein [Acidimicrobiia bacterium]